MDIINAYVKYNIFGKNKTIHVMRVTIFFVKKCESKTCQKFRKKYSYKLKKLKINTLPKTPR